MWPSASSPLCGPGPSGRVAGAPTQRQRQPVRLDQSRPPQQPCGIVAEVGRRLGADPARQAAAERVPRAHAPCAEGRDRMAVGDHRPPECFVRLRAEFSFVRTHGALAQRTPSADARSAHCQYRTQPQGILLRIDHRRHPPVVREYIRPCLQLLAAHSRRGRIHLRRP